MYSSKTEALNLFGSLFQLGGNCRDDSTEFWDKKVCIHYVTQQTGKNVAFPKTKSLQWCYQTANKGIPACPAPINSKVSQLVPLLSDRPWQQQCYFVTWLREKAKHQIQSQVTKCISSLERRAVQTNCELDRFKLLSFRHKQAQSFFIGQLRTPVPYPQAAGAVLAGVSVSPPQSAIACISKHDDKEGFKSRGWHYLILRPYASYSVTHISPTVKRTERSTTQSQAARRGGVGWLKTVDSRQCLTSQLNNKTSACFWLDEQQAAVSACGTGLELDG